MKQFIILLAVAFLSITIGFIIGSRQPTPLHSIRYQVITYNDSNVVMDGDRVVGVLAYDSTSKLDQLIDSDNQ